jgi:hypothetical protein
MAEDSETSADDTEPENGMTFIRRHNVRSSHALKRNANGEVSDWSSLSLLFYIQSRSLNSAYFGNPIARNNFKMFST